MTARLEFNWIDDLRTSIREASGTDGPTVQARNPIYIAEHATGVALRTPSPAVEHETVRQKFRVFAVEADNSGNPVEEFAVNLDLIRVRSLRSDQHAAVVHVDISSTRIIDDVELDRLAEFATLVADRYRLDPNPFTNALEDFAAMGILPSDNANPIQGPTA